jgi:RimJ/RimL family protein N-acetyltransferase
MTSRNYEVFIEGDTIDLVLPSELAIDRDGWHTWLNDVERNQFTGHAQIPITRDTQRSFLEGLLRPDATRFALLVRPKDNESVVGVVSLSSIDRVHRRAETALILSRTAGRSRYALFVGMEAKARIVEHAFETMGLERIMGTQVVELDDWQRFQTLFGFRPEGLLRDHYRRGHRVYDILVSACTYQDYLRIKKQNGSYWPGKGRLLELLRTVPEGNLSAGLKAVIDEYVATNWNSEEYGG